MEKQQVNVWYCVCASLSLSLFSELLFVMIDLWARFNCDVLIVTRAKAVKQKAREGERKGERKRSDGGNTCMKQNASLNSFALLSFPLFLSFYSLSNLYSIFMVSTFSMREKYDKIQEIKMRARQKKNRNKGS